MWYNLKQPSSLVKRRLSWTPVLSRGDGKIFDFDCYLFVSRSLLALLDSQKTLSRRGIEQDFLFSRRDFVAPILKHLLHSEGVPRSVIPRMGGAGCGQKHDARFTPSNK